MVAVSLCPMKDQIYKYILSQHREIAKIITFVTLKIKPII